MSFEVPVMIRVIARQALNCIVFILMKETFVSLIINFITVIKVWSGKGLVNG